MNPYIQPVELEKAYRLLNHGPTVLVSAQHEDERNVMTAAWACALELVPAKVSVVLDKSTKTRKLIEASGYFILQVPTLKQIKLVQQLGAISQFNDPQKLEHCHTPLFQFEDYPLPAVEDCAAWLICELISEPHNQQTHDLFIGRVVAAYADSRVFRNGHWYYHEVSSEWKSLHHVAGGHYYTIGDPVDANKCL
ncbi:flavin reductase family protein [Acinetobacter wuhouensis]|uniref:flavin reductase family protein n=1 Tax=Acinetobacter wuhouensis TaxID=1879050 RepID=UPI00083A4C73|nr:flavin reductase family protein [Acinetobacter wuhouensis]AXQ22908.1 flavin reductase family protein [Acinetobacter wuhouensis]